MKGFKVSCALPDTVKSLLIITSLGCPQPFLCVNGKETSATDCERKDRNETNLALAFP
jgi:hypothetical protein